MKKRTFIIIILVVLLCAATVAALVLRTNREKQKATTAPSTQQTSVQTTRLDPNEDLLILVNDRHPIPEEYQPQLVGTEFEQKIDKRAAKPLAQMMKACRAAGCNPLPCSGYRSVEEQKQILEDKINEYRNLGYAQKDAEKEALVWVVRPGTSEHHTGLAMDILDLDYEILDEKQAETDTAQWLMQHSWEYGFIVRYPEDKKDITHVGFESWHYRYVGKVHAKKIHDAGLCLEEYVENASQ